MLNVSAAPVPFSPKSTGAMMNAPVAGVVAEMTSDEFSHRLRSRLSSCL